MDQETFSDRLKACRESLGLTQEQLAKSMGWSHMTISRWERGGSAPQGRNIHLLAGRFGVNVEWLKDGVEPKYPQVLQRTGRTSERASTLNSPIFPASTDITLFVEALRWAAAQPDSQELLKGDFEQLIQTMNQRGDLGVDEYHRGLLRNRIMQVAMSRKALFTERKLEAIFEAAWEEGKGMGTQPDDIQLGRYIDVAMA